MMIMIFIVIIVMLKQQEKARWRVIRYDDAVDDDAEYKGSSRHRKSRR